MQHIVFLDVRITATDYELEAVAGQVGAVPLRQIMIPIECFKICINMYMSE